MMRDQQLRQNQLDGSASTSGNSNNLVCAGCRFNDSDIRLRGCGCTLHTRCVPLSLVLAPQKQHNDAPFPSPVCTPTVPCPTCQSPVSSVQMVPLDFSNLEKAIEIQKSCVLGSSDCGSVNSDTSSAKPGSKRSREESNNTHAESLYVLLSNSRGSLSSSGGGLASADLQRTGRWTEEEIAYVDFLINAFDHGALPLPHGIKLNDFLGDMLLCKSSRLTKKMKNAKLSTRSFKLTSNPQFDLSQNCEALSNLEEKFLLSIQSEPVQLELRFNLSKQWRTHFSNMCVQVGYNMLDGNEWINSLEEMENRASQAEDVVRQSRRRRMGLALRTDTGSAASQGVFVSGVKADIAADRLSPLLSSEDPLTASSSSQMKMGETRALPLMSYDPNRTAPSIDDSNHSTDFLKSMMDNLGEDDPMMDGNDSRSSVRQGRPRTFSEDFSAVLVDLMEPNQSAAPNLTNSMVEHSFAETSGQMNGHYCGPFLDAVISYIETGDLPFQHVDIFVPSFVPQDSGNTADGSNDGTGQGNQELRLFQAGFATRGDLDPLQAFPWNEYGAYSEKFSFKPGHGLVGRVYSSGEASWETGIHKMDAKYFERAGGAKVYGVKTAVGIPISTPMVGRICIVLYSSSELAMDPNLMNTIVEEISGYSPEPKWRLVIEMNDEQEDAVQTKEAASTQLGLSLDSGPNPVGLPDQQAPSGPSFSLPANSRPSLPPPLLPSPALHSLQRRSIDRSTSATAHTVADEISDEEEHCLISLLGDNMPAMSSEGEADECSSSSSAQLLPHYMHIRLLLLRSSQRRTAEENDMLDVLKKSYRSYARNNRRNGKELANLLVRDWVCLKASFEPIHPTASSLPSPSSSLMMGMKPISLPSPAMNAKASPVMSGLDNGMMYKSHAMNQTIKQADQCAPLPSFPSLSRPGGTNNGSVMSAPTLYNRSQRTLSIDDTSQQSPTMMQHQQSFQSSPSIAGVTPEGSQRRPTYGNLSDIRNSVGNSATVSNTNNAPLAPQPQMGHSRVILR